MQYCGNYDAIGVRDDRLFTTYRSKMISITKLCDSVDCCLKFMRFDHQPVRLPLDSLQCDCGSGHVIARLIPYLLETFTRFVDRCFEWLTVDKLYLIEVKDILTTSQSQLKDLENKLRMAKLLFASAISDLRKEKMVRESLDDEYRSFDTTELRQNDRKSRRLKLEILAVRRAIKSIEQEAGDEPDGCVDSPDSLREVAPSDLRYYQGRLTSKSGQLQKLQEYHNDYKNLCNERSQCNQRVKELTKSVRRMRKQKEKLGELYDACVDRISHTENILSHKVQPEL